MAVGENCRVAGKTCIFFAIAGAHLVDDFPVISQSEFLTSLRAKRAAAPDAFAAHLLSVVLVTSGSAARCWRHP
jgi:hypothetical protein